MSYSDTWKVAKCCLYEKKSMLKKIKNKKIKKRGGGGVGNILKKREQHRVLSTSTCDFNIKIYKQL
jgi:hypothetical protein